MADVAIILHMAPAKVFQIIFRIIQTFQLDSKKRVEDKVCRRMYALVACADNEGRRMKSKWS